MLYENIETVASNVLFYNISVDCIRAQRAFSIQMPDQYVFCHLAFLEWVIFNILPYKLLTRQQGCGSGPSITIRKFFNGSGSYPGYVKLYKKYQILQKNCFFKFLGKFLKFWFAGSGSGQKWTGSATMFWSIPNLLPVFRIDKYLLWYQYLRVPNLGLFIKFTDWALLKKNKSSGLVKMN